MTQAVINYAEALFELGMTRSEADEAARIFKMTPVLLETLENPLISQEEKGRVIDRIFRGPVEAAAGHPTGNAQGHPAEDAAGYPTEDAVGRPTEDAARRPTEDAAGHPTGNAQGRPEGEAAGRPADRMMRHFLKVVCRHGRAGEIPEILDAFRELLLQREGVLRARLSYVTPPGTGVEERMKAFLRQKYGKREVALTLERDPSLLGGFLLEAEDCEYDYSLRGRYKRLSQALIRR